MTDFVNKGLAFILIPYFTHTMTPVQFGEYEKVLILYTFCQLFCWMNQNTYLLKRYGQGKDFTTLIVGGIVISAPLSLFVTMVGVFCFSLDFYVLIYIGVTSVSSLVMVSYISKLQVDSDAMVYLSSQLFCTIINLAGALLFVYFGFGGIGRFVGLTIGINFFALIIVVNNIKLGKIDFSSFNIKERVCFGLNLLPHNIINGWLRDNLAKIIVVTVVGNEKTLGLFGVVFSFAFSFNILMSSVNGVLNKNIFKDTVSHDIDFGWFLKHLLIMMSIWCVLSPMIYFMFLFVVAKVYHAYSYLIFIFCLAFTLNSTSTIIGNYLICKDLAIVVSKSSMVSVIIYALLILLISAFLGEYIHVAHIAVLYLFSSFAQIIFLFYNLRKYKNEISCYSVRVD